MDAPPTPTPLSPWAVIAVLAFTAACIAFWWWAFGGWLW